MWTRSGFVRTVSCVCVPVKPRCVNRMWVPAAGPARTMEENEEPAHRDCAFPSQSFRIFQTIWCLLLPLFVVNPLRG